VRTEPLIQSLSHLLLQVSDLDGALSFYVDLLGFQVRERSQLADGRTFVSTNQGLGLTTFPPGAATGQSLDHLAFRCPTGIEPVVEKLRAAGIAYEGPRRNAYGQSVYFRDPDGNRVECHDAEAAG
jgi:catechol 2,3-dioxygenase-like lactoylglutathione lyase family enzyme